MPTIGTGSTITVSPPKVSLDGGEIFYGDKIVISSPEQGHIAYSINSEDYIYSYESQITIVMKEDTELKVKAWVDNLVEGVEYITPEAVYTYTVKNIKLLDEVCEPIYDDVRSLDSGELIVQSGGLWAYADSYGQPLSDFSYDYISNFSNGLAVVSADGKYGFIDETGKIAISMIYDGATEFSNGLAAVNVNDMWGYINTDGEMVIQPVYSSALGFSEGYAVVTTPASETTEMPLITKIIDTENNMLFSTSSYTVISGFHNGTARILSSVDGGVMGLISTKGTIVLTPKYRMIKDFSEGAAAVLDISGKYGFIDTNGKEITGCIYDAVYDFSDGLAAVQKDGNGDI